MYFMSCFIEVTKAKTGKKIFLNVAQIVLFEGKYIETTYGDGTCLVVEETFEEIAEKIRRSTHPDAVDHCFEDILRYD